jgi:hypothetical protein
MLERPSDESCVPARVCTRSGDVGQRRDNGGTGRDSPEGRRACDLLLCLREASETKVVWVTGPRLSGSFGTVAKLAWDRKDGDRREEVNNVKLTKNLGMLLLGIWLIATGLVQVFSISIPAIGILLPLLAIVAGVLILLSR